jgi:gamma-glutamyltranspeptidase
MPDILFVEQYAVSPDTAKVLERRGHELQIVNQIGEVSAVRGRAGGTLTAAQDSRGPGSGGVVKSAVD